MTSELEAKLASADRRFAKASGKLERKVYGDSTERLKVRIKGLDAAEASLVVAGREIASVTVAHGRAELDLESAAGAVPPMRAGETVQVSVDEVVALEGTLVED
ncbi:MAG: hypothetical protein R3305_01785 [Gammaproteobacteria bacterium]|nr:hypothetical protein [Gammaproteobacteria bacterium]